MYLLYCNLYVKLESVFIFVGEKESLGAATHQRKFSLKIPPSKLRDENLLQ